MAKLTKEAKLQKLHEILNQSQQRIDTYYAQTPAQTSVRTPEQTSARTPAQTSARTPARTPTSKFRVGDFVMAKTEECGKWPGKIEDVLPDNKYTVRFYDNKTEVVDAITREGIENITKVEDKFDNDKKQNNECRKLDNQYTKAIKYGNKDIQIRKIIKTIEDKTIEDKTKTRHTLTKKSDDPNKIYSGVVLPTEKDFNIENSINIIKKFYEESNVNIEPTDIDEDIPSINKDIPSIIRDYVIIYFRGIINNKRRIIPPIVPEILQDYKQVIDELILNKENFDNYKDILRTGLKLILKILYPVNYEEDTEEDLQKEFNSEIKRITQIPINKTQESSKRPRESPHSSRSDNKRYKQQNPINETQDSDDGITTPNLEEYTAQLTKESEAIEARMKKIEKLGNLKARKKELQEEINKINKEIKQLGNEINTEIEQLGNKKVNGGKPKSTKPEQKPNPKSTKPEQKPNPKSTKPEQKPKSKSIKVKK
jgi:hypothetical protein